jgi:hypothetical protein
VTTDDLIKVFREIGFPAAVAGFVLYRLEGALKEVLKALVEVRLAIQALRNDHVHTS